MSHRPPTKVSELRDNHPFADFVRILGRGKTGSRSLTQTEAAAAMTMMLDGTAEAAQIGALLMLLRVKEESPAELAGFVDASRAAINAPAIAVDIDWSSYAGKKNQLPWHLLAAKLLAQNGRRIFIHGAEGTQTDRLYTEAAVAVVGIPICANWQDVTTALATGNICYVSMATMSPNFYELLFYRRLLGLRSAMHSVARLVNPLRAPLSLQGVFHPAYAPSHQQASLLLGQPHALAFKGEGGEAEIRPDADTKLAVVWRGQADTLTWPRQLPHKATKLANLDSQQLNALWCGQWQDQYGEAAVVSTTAAVLWLDHGCGSIDEALQQAQTLWQNRQR